MVLTDSVNGGNQMNEKFYALPVEKQKRIINAGFKVFARNSYKKSPVNEIAMEADISKSLLFFYFKNKKELYLFLLKQVELITANTLKNEGAFEGDDIFDMMYKGLVVKTRIMRAYPDMSKFAIKAYYEEDPEVKEQVRKIISPYTTAETNPVMPPLDPAKFKYGLDLKMMYQDIYLASEGFVWRMQQASDYDADKFEKEYKDLIDFWKKMYLK